MGKLADALRKEIKSYESRKWTGKIGGDEFTLYAKPLSPADVEKVRKKYPEFTTQPEPAAMVNVTCDKAYLTEDCTGPKAMSVNIEGKFLKQAKVELIGDIFGALFGEDFDDDTDFDGKVKNSEANQPD